MSRSPAAIAGILVALLVGPALHAQATRTFVSGVGSDANTCSRTAPCRTFAGAIVKTFINGEINALDPGGYGTVNITKSITINGDFTLASDLASGTTGVIVNIPVSVNDPKRRVRLRNLKVNGTGASGAVGTSTGITGIRFINGTELVVEDCLIENFSQFGIDINFGATTGVNARVVVDDTTINEVGLSAVRVTGGTGTLRAFLNRVLINKAGFGIDIASGHTATVEDSSVVNVTNQAIAAAGGAVVNVDRGVVAYSGTGVSAAAGSTVRIADLAILNNGTGINIAAGGTVASLGGNKNAGNVTPGAPNLNIPLQ